MLKIEMDDYASLADDIEEAVTMINDNLDGEISKDEKYLTVCHGTISELKQILFSALNQLQKIEGK